MNQPKPNQNKEALGKGIRSLLQSIDADLKTGSGQLKPAVVETATGSFRIPVDEIDINPKQPRRYFDEEALNELASSIKSHDIIQPVTVSKMPSGRYRLVSGERRLRASKLAGLKDIPAYIRQIERGLKTVSVEALSKLSPLLTSPRPLNRSRPKGAGLLLFCLASPME